MDPNNYPLISKRSIKDFTSEEYYAYIKSLEIRPPKPQELFFKLTKTGKPSVTVKHRKPAYITPKEIDDIADQNGVSRRELWLYIAKRKGLEIRRD